ncbi:ATP-binding protein [Muricoccus radiodurans]|uniref:ATP-binding protein n=1 Tax=Muricoccus radiodurans TaxID=2231721 RepID=UPI003CEEF6C1
MSPDFPIPGAGPAGGYAFGRYAVLPARRALLVDGREAAIGGRAFDLLLALIERREAVVTKDALLELVWPGRVVEEGNLTVHVAALRKLLGAGVIATVSGKGYRFVAPLDPDGPQPAVPAPPPPPLPGQSPADLPRPLTRMIGREADVEAVAARLVSGRLVTILGGGGVGKTRLALEVADRVAADFPDGVWFADLGGQTDPAALPRTIARALGIDVRNFAYRASSLLWLTPRRGLLLLDNCEHMLDPVAEMAEAILRAAPRITILATSREPLRAEGEHRHRLAPLAVPEPDDGIAGAGPEAYPAGALFLERARAVIGPFVPSAEEAQDILAICRQLDGLPLALELAAPLLQSLRPGQLREMLEQRLAPLAEGRRTAPTRQKTLRATIAWSLDLLEPVERALLGRLAAARGSWSMEASRALAADGTETDALPALIAGLVDKSLVQADLSRDPPRYRLLEATRFIIGESVPAAETWQTRARLAQWLTGLCRAAEANWEVTGDAAWHARYRPEWELLRTNLAWALDEGGDAALGATLASVTGPFWGEFASTGELTQVFDRALALRPADLPSGTEGRLWLGRSGWLALGEPGAPAASARAVALLRDDPDPSALGRALSHQALHAMMAGDASGAAARLAEAAEWLGRAAETKAMIGLQRLRALLLLRRGAVDEAGVVLSAALALADRLAAQRDRALVLGDLAELAFSSGRVGEALTIVERALEELGPGRIRSAWVQHLHGAMATYSLMQDDLPRARRIATDRLYATRIMGMPAEVTANLERFGLLAAREGKPDIAARLMGFGEVRQQQGGTLRGLSAQAVHDKLRQEVSAALPPDALRTLITEGAGYSEEQAIAAAS